MILRNISQAVRRGLNHNDQEALDIFNVLSRNRVWLVSDALWMSGGELNVAARWILDTMRKFDYDADKVGAEVLLKNFLGGEWRA